jgi:phage repressor protein C with HTH and peptisase S24 domain
VLFERDWFRRNIGQVEQFASPHLFEVPDDSMEPTLHKGDLVLGFDVYGPTEAAPTNGVYLVWFSAGEITKEERDRVRAKVNSEGFPPRTFPRRIEWKAGSENSFLIRCDNKSAYPDVAEVDEKAILSVIVIWQVFWHGHLI